MIISVIGGRPNFIKFAAVIKHIPKGSDHLILYTGQHYDYNLYNSFFEELQLPPPDNNLGVGSGSHGVQTAKILIGCEKYFQKNKPKLVIVYGDMNSTLGASLAAAKLNISIAHVEAGTRCFDNSVPEEVNRTIIDHISMLLFAPTENAKHNLINEGQRKKTFFTGDTTFDTFLKIEKELNEDYYKALYLRKDNYFLCTLHRPSNTDNKITLNYILEQLILLRQPVVFLLHPRTQKMLIKFKLLNKIKDTNILIKPTSKYIESLSLQKYASAVLTDSGGIQKEAYYLKKPCITFRDTTEWPELVATGWNKLWYPEKNPLEILIKKFRMPKQHPSFFGSGKAGKEIVYKIMDFIK